VVEPVFVLRAMTLELEIRVNRRTSSLMQEQRELANRAALLLRMGLERRDTSIVEVSSAMDAVLAGERLERIGSFGVAPRAGDLGAMARRLELALETGRLLVERKRREPLSEQEFEAPELPPLPPPKKEPNDTSFEIKFVDEVGQAVTGIDVELSLGSELHDSSTNGAGIALLSGVVGSSARARVPDIAPLDKALDARWKAPRKGHSPAQNVRADVTFLGGKLAPVGLSPVIENVVVLRPPLGRIYVELFDKWGKLRHTDCKYEIKGPQTYSGRTDELGRVLLDDVFPGDYTLTLEVVIFDGPDERTDVYESPLVVLPAGAGDPEVRLLGAVPWVVLARLHGYFNTNKAFLLPTAFAGMKELRKLFADNNPGELLVVGHADGAGGSEANDELSLERARATIAFLEDDVDAWLVYYDKAVLPEKRWGRLEDGLMLRALPDFPKRPKGEDPVRWFQRTRSLTVDGKAGPQTRRQLISEYMSLDGLSLAEAGLEIFPTAHGAGENFPADESAENPEAKPGDERRDLHDRRVEFFFFDPEFGIVPPPPGGNSKAGATEYATWKRRAIDVRDLEAAPPDGPKLEFVELADLHFRSNSAVVLPASEKPSDTEEPSDAEPSPTSAGAFASALAFAQRHPLKKILVAGHTDTAGGESDNQKLSEERARVALCCLEGGSERREEFAALTHGRSKVADQKQILAWAARAFGFDCDPGKVDGNAATAKRAIEGFQADYNAKREELGFAEAEELDVDGAFGPKTWGAVFDCYESALAREVSEAETAEERAQALAELRANLRFVDDERQDLGFGEHHPIDQLGEDGYRSEENRRVEILFFDPGQEPELDDVPPEDSDIYRPGIYARMPIPVGGTALGALMRLSKVAHRLRSNSGCVPLANMAYKLDAGGRIFEGITDEEGLVSHDLLPPGDHELEIDGKKTKLSSLPRSAKPVLHVFRGFFLGSSG
jgi:outer membrane protein OmpA-like peptidoglycan-associated protein